jgi:hypothetical protein
MADVVASGAKISRYSYMSESGRVAYLEEDCDIAAYITAIGGAAAFQAKYPDYPAVYDGCSSLIRRLPYFVAPAVAEAPETHGADAWEGM